MSKEYHFFTASISYYSGNNFNDLIEEEKNHDGYIHWYIGKHHVKIGDTCFIYYSNLPDYSSRILFVGVVEDTDYGKNSEISIFDKAKPKEKYAKFKLKRVALEDNKVFNLERLRKHYHLLNEKGQFSYMHIYPDQHKQLIEDVESKLKNTKKDLEYVNRYFNEKYCMCEFGCKDHFIEENGFYYIERHHLVERNLINKNKHIDNIDKLINDERNIYNLCPNCHMKIHHIRIEERKPMIEKLYLLNKSFYDDNFKELKKGKSSLDWLYEIYKCNK